MSAHKPLDIFSPCVGPDNTCARKDHQIPTPKPVLKSGAVYLSDNGCAICASCAGMTALYTGRDISGQPVLRVTTAEVREWREALGRPMTCEAGCTMLSTIIGADGWPMAVSR